MPVRKSHGSVTSNFRNIHAFRVLSGMLVCTLFISFSSIYQVDLHKAGFETDVTVSRSGNTDNILDNLKRLDHDIIIFLHLHKSGGSFFVDLVSKFPGQTMPRRKGGNALLFCPPPQNQSTALQTLCGNSSQALMPFWLWSARIQVITIILSPNHIFDTSTMVCGSCRSTSSPASGSLSSRTSAGSGRP